uniref:Endonuclease/exonuclease/phosphatase domain-containing protein n=1 Tax=Micrurus paraensis TaxID=1970185 RepID=A0A2D4KHW3_9SAUR
MFNYFNYTSADYISSFGLCMLGHALFVVFQEIQLLLKSTTVNKSGVPLYIKGTINARQIFADEDGRILMVEVTMNQKHILLIVIYAPNNKQHEFYGKLHKKIIKLEYENICAVGDFNAIVDKHPLNPFLK